MLTYQKLRKSGNSWVVTIPKEEVEQQNLQEGQLLAIQYQPAEIRTVLSDELKALVEESWKKNETGLRYLGGR